jgi:hypothetical protein
LTDVLQQLEAVHSRHAKIRQNRRNFQVFKLANGFQSVRSGFNVKAFATERRLECGLHLNVVINYK